LNRAKFDLILDSEGCGRIEKISFEAYNESTCLIEPVERFKDHTSYYPKRVLADQIYWTRENRSNCKEHGIRLSGPKNAVNFYHIIRIRNESVQDSETDALCIFASDPILVYFILLFTK